MIQNLHKSRLLSVRILIIFFVCETPFYSFRTRIVDLFYISGLANKKFREEVDDLCFS